MDSGLRYSVTLAVALQAWAVSGRADTAWTEGFEGPNVSWREAGSDVQYRIVRHERVPASGRNKTGAEYVAVEGATGTYVHLEHRVGDSLVIDELMPSVWVRADRAGPQIGIRIVLPRTPDPRTGAPVSTLILGSTYTDVGRWQRLFVDTVPQRLARQVRSLRAELATSVDDREAYVEAVCLNVYGGPGLTKTWIDDLTLAGHVASRTGASIPPRTEASSRPTPIASAMSRPPVELSGGLLTVDGRPFFPRVIQYRGEPLDRLQQLGFNAIWIDSPPSSSLLADASRLGLWLICPPPETLHAPAGNAGVSEPFTLGPEYDTVLAWCLGRRLASAELDATRQRIQRLRKADGVRRRPIVCGVLDALREFSRYADILLLDRRPLGTSLELQDYGRWVQRQPRLARPGTPIWTTVQTQPSAALYEQLSALAPDRTPPTALSHEQIALLAYTALAAGSRGFFFVTESDLLDGGPDVQRRSMALELLNLELSLLEPWLAAGTPQASIEAGGREMTGPVLRVNRSQLALPFWSSAGAQYAPDVPSTRNLAVLVPGIPESANAYEIAAGGLASLKHRRVTGGTQLTLERFGLRSALVLAQDAILVSELTRRVEQIGPRSAQLHRDLAADALQATIEIQRELPPGAVTAAEASIRLREAQQSTQIADSYLAAREYRRARDAAGQAMRVLQMLQRQYWKDAVAELSSPVTSPGACSFATLPWHKRLGDRIRASQYGQNQLAGGDFERLDLLLRYGWEHMEHPAEGCTTSVDLVPKASRSGNTGLRILAAPADPDNVPAVVEMPPVWIISPPLPVEAGQLIVIHGYARAPKPIAGSEDGLMIFDSFSGEGLGERVGRTNGWQPFTLFRVAPRSGSLRVTFALSGLGEAHVDDVTIRPLYPATPATAHQLGGSRHW